MTFFLILGGLRDAPGFLTIERGDETEELDIENDVEEQTFGAAPFSEGDAIPPSADTPEEEANRETLRAATLEGGGGEKEKTKSKPDSDGKGECC